MSAAQKSGANQLHVVNPADHIRDDAYPAPTNYDEMWAFLRRDLTVTIKPDQDVDKWKIKMKDADSNDNKKAVEWTIDDMPPFNRPYTEATLKRIFDYVLELHAEWKKLALQRDSDPRNCKRR